MSSLTHVDCFYGSMRMTVYLAELSAALLDSAIEAAVPTSRPIRRA